MVDVLKKKGERKKIVPWTIHTQQKTKLKWHHTMIFNAHTVPIQRRAGPPTHKTLVAHVVAGPPGILGVGEGVHTAASSEGPTAERLGA